MEILGWIFWIVIFIVVGAWVCHTQNAIEADKTRREERARLEERQRFEREESDRRP